METDRLVLIPLDPAAAAALREGAVERADRIIGATLGSEFRQTDVMDVLGIQASLPAEAIIWGVWLMLERDPAITVGSVGFMGPPNAGGELEIGYSVVESRRRRGYLAEGAGALLDWAFARPDVRAVRARCDPDNTASIRSLERLGFVWTGWTKQYLSWRREPAPPSPSR